MCLVTFGWEAVDAGRKYVEAPRGELKWAILELLTTCDLGCKWCYANAPTRAGTSMSRERALWLIDFLADAGFTQITFSGGEPLLCPYLDELVARSTEKGLIAHLNTSGFLLDEGRAVRLAERGLSQAQINLDSVDREMHDSVRGKAGCFDRAVRALEATLAAGMTATSETVVTGENEAEVIDIVEFARSLGVQRCRIWDMTPADGLAADSIHLVPTDYLRTLREANEYAEKTGAVNVISTEPHFPRQGDTALISYGGFCMARTAKIGVHVLPNGDAVYCATDRRKLYNVFDLDSPDELGVVHRRSVERHLETSALSDSCHSCDLLDACRGGCLTRQRASKNNMDYVCPKAGEHPREQHSRSDPADRACRDEGHSTCGGKEPKGVQKVVPAGKRL